MKRALVVAALAAGVAVPAVPAQAAPWCGRIANVNCWNGSHYCRVWVAETRTCVHTDV